jgi:hypothetical protein
VFTGEIVSASSRDGAVVLNVGELLANFPVALLVAV